MQTHYEFLIIGGGPGGTPAAMALAAAGRTVLLVEKGPGPGGTCLFEGCIPSKIYHEAARRLREFRTAGDFGLNTTGEMAVDWTALQARKTAILERRSQAARQRLEAFESLDYITGQARLCGPRTAEITPADGTAFTVHFQVAIIASGSEPFLPPIPGIDLPGVVDSDALLASPELPKRMVIIGGGPIGIELGQIFHAFGVEIEIIEAGPRILGHADAELASRLQQELITEGIGIHAASRVEAIEATASGLSVHHHPLADGESATCTADTVLVVTGRRPRVTDLGLETTSVTVGAHGIEVNANLETRERGVYALGDVIGPPMFAHWATAQALALARHLLGQPAAFPRANDNTDVVFSHPELGMAGMTEDQASQAGMVVDVARYDFAADARAQISGEENGLLKIVADHSTRQIVGVHVLAAGASGLMGEAAVLIRNGVTLEELASAIHPHPTWSESFVQAARSALAKAQRRHHMNDAARPTPP